MKLLVGIPTHKRPELLRECLDSIAAQGGALPEIEVFIADNDPGGMQGIAVVEQLAARFPYPLRGTAVVQPGISAVRNAILDEARRRGADFIAMIDDDVRADPWWLSKLFAKSTETGSGIFAGPVFFDFPEGTSDFLRTAFLGGSPSSGPIDLINGTTGVLIDAKTLDASGWPKFDPAFGLTGGGDKEWFSRLKGMGARFEWVSDAHVYETVPPSRANLKWFLKRRYRYGIDDIRIDRLHGTPASRVVLMAQALGLFALSPLYALLLFTDRRYYHMGRFARAFGRLSAPFGVKVQEYADRHQEMKNEAKPLAELRSCYMLSNKSHDGSAPRLRGYLYMPEESPSLRALDRRGFALAIEIERHRHEMLGASSTLVDGSLGEGGLYDENISVADACRVSKPRASARYLYSIAAEYRPSTILELGTNVGISSSYLAGAGGKVTSLEASPYRLRLAQRLHQQLGLNNIDYVHGLFTETLDATLRDLPPVELAFIDGHHQYQPTLDYFEAIRRQARPDCVFIFDDIGWSEGMERAWAELKPHFETTAEVGGMGIGFNRPRRTAQ